MAAGIERARSDGDLETVSSGVRRSSLPYFQNLQETNTGNVLLARDPEQQDELQLSDEETEGKAKFEKFKKHNKGLGNEVVFLATALKDYALSIERLEARQTLRRVHCVLTAPSQGEEKPSISEDKAPPALSIENRSKDPNEPLVSRHPPNESLVPNEPPNESFVPMDPPDKPLIPGDPDARESLKNGDKEALGLLEASEDEIESNESQAGVNTGLIPTNQVFESSVRAVGSQESMRVGSQEPVVSQAFKSGPSKSSCDQDSYPRAGSFVEPRAAEELQALKASQDLVDEENCFAKGGSYSSYHEKSAPIVLYLYVRDRPNNVSTDTSSPAELDENRKMPPLPSASKATDNRESWARKEKNGDIHEEAGLGVSLLSATTPLVAKEIAYDRKVEVGKRLKERKPWRKFLRVFSCGVCRSE